MQLDSNINVRFTADEKRRIQEDAALIGVSVSALVRGLYIGKPMVFGRNADILRQLRQLGYIVRENGSDAGVLSVITTCIEHLSHASKED